MTTITPAKPLKRVRGSLKREKRSKNLLITFALLMLLGPMLIPIYWLVVNAFRPNEDTLALPLRLLPGRFTLENIFAQLSDSEGFLRYFLNSGITSTAAMFLTTICAVLAGYALSRLRFPGRRTILIGILASQMFPIVLVVVSLYILYNQIGLLNTYAGLTLAFSSLSLPFGIWMMRSFFDTVPHELDEAAFMDGASRIQTLWIILLPVVRPGLVSVALFAFLNAWNNLLIALTLTTSPDMRTIPPGFLITYVGEFQYRWADAMAGSLIVTLPVTIIFIFLQKYLIGGLTAGAVKG
jgi:multiple sugar transport system permease protein